MKRKLAFFITCYFTGGIIPLILDGGLYYIILILITAGVMVCLCDRLEPVIKVLALAFFCSGLFIFSLDNVYIDNAINRYQGRWVQAEGTILQNLDQNRYVLYINTMTYKDMVTGYRGKAVLFVNRTKVLAPGQSIRLQGEIGSFEGRDMASYYRGLGARFHIRSYNEYIDLLPAAYNIRYFSFKAAQWVKDTIEKHFPAQSGDVLKGLLLGGRHVNPDIKERFSGAGISHLLAVSGLHVGLLAGILVLVLKKAGLSQTVQFLTVCSFLTFFSFMVGLTPSVIRASIMVAVMLMAGVVNRQQDTLTSLLFTAFIIVSLSPYTVYSVSFQLSFLSCLGIVLFYPSLLEALGFIGKYLSTSIALTLSSQVLVIPLMIYYFQHFTPVSVITNLIVIPLAGLLLWNTIAFIFLAGLKIPLYVVIVYINNIIVEILNWVIAAAGKIPYGNIKIESTDYTLMALYYLAAGIGLVFLRIKRIRRDDV